jgi:hypothetical protein
MSLRSYIKKRVKIKRNKERKEGRKKEGQHSE